MKMFQWLILTISFMLILTNIRMFGSIESDGMWDLIEDYVAYQEPSENVSSALLLAFNCETIDLADQESSDATELVRFLQKADVDNQFIKMLEKRAQVPSISIEQRLHSIQAVLDDLSSKLSMQESSSSRRGDIIESDITKIFWHMLEERVRARKRLNGEPRLKLGRSKARSLIDKNGIISKLASELAAFKTDGAPATEALQDPEVETFVVRKNPRIESTPKMLSAADIVTEKKSYDLGMYQPREIMQQSIQNPVQVAQQQPMVVQQPVVPVMQNWQQPQPVIGNNAQMASMAMQLQASAMAMQQQASALLMQAQQPGAYNPYLMPQAYGYQQPYGFVNPMIQQPQPQLPQPQYVPQGTYLKDERKKFDCKQEKVAQMMRYLDKLAQAGEVYVQQALKLLDIEFDIIEHLLAGFAGSPIEKLVLKRKMLLKQCPPLIVALYEVVMDIASSTPSDGSDKLYNYFVRRGKKGSTCSFGVSSKKKFLREMLYTLEQNYELIEKMQRMVAFNK